MAKREERLYTHDEVVRILQCLGLSPKQIARAFHHPVMPQAPSDPCMHFGHGRGAGPCIRAPRDDQRRPPLDIELS